MKMALGWPCISIVMFNHKGNTDEVIGYSFIKELTNLKLKKLILEVVLIFPNIKVTHLSQFYLRGIKGSREESS